MTIDRAAVDESPKRVLSDDDPVLQDLRKRWDEYLAPLNELDAGERLRKFIREPIALRGKVKAGETY